MSGPVRSGSGWRMTLPEKGSPMVSIWAHTPNNAEYMAHRENLECMRKMEDERVREAREQAALAAEFVKQAWAEYRKIRARA